MNSCLYLRVSSDEQVENFSLSTQEKICKDKASQLGYQVSVIFREEGKSGKNISGRPELIKLLEYVRKNKSRIGAVIVYRIDRLSRSTVDYLSIRKLLAESGCIVVSATEPTGSSPTEKLVETVLAAFGELDNSIRAERTRNGLRARFLSGLPLSHLPMGYKYLNSKTIIRDSNFEKVKHYWNIMATGTKTLKDIAEIMNIYVPSAGRIFRNPIYMGLVHSPTYKEKIKGQFEPMISEEQFYKVQAILDGRSTQIITQKRCRDNESFPLRGIVKCVCGKGFTGAFSHGHGGIYRYYFCINRCKGTNIRAEKLEEQLLEILRYLQPTEETVNMFTLMVKSTYYRRLQSLKDRQSEAEKEILNLKDLYNKLVDKNLSGLYSDQIFKEQSKIIEEKLAVANLIKSEITIDKYNIEELVNFTKALLYDLVRAYEVSNLEQKRALIGSIMPSGLTFDTKLNRTYELSPLFATMRYIRPIINSGAPGGNRTPTRWSEATYSIR